MLQARWIQVATTQGRRACSVCGTLIAGDSASCPVCALRGAVETQSDSVSDLSHHNDAAPGAADISSDLRFEHYTVLKNAEGKPFELGSGGMGVAYKAFDVHLQCPVALKIIKSQLFGNDSARLRFVREARAAASVRHANVASVFHLGVSGGNYFYAMEFVDGESLAALIRRSGGMETDLALEIAGQVASGLAAIEKQHLVHRDIKPSNIMVSLEDGKVENVKIIDLGLAKGVAEENTLSTLGAFTGTPAYASPEQFAGIATDIRSDLYSLGVTLWEMLSGKLPFGGTASELMYQHQHAEPPAQELKNVPAPVIALLEVLLAKDPNQRFQNPAQLQQAIAKLRGAIASGLRLTPDELNPAGDQAADKLLKVRPKKRTVRWLLSAGLCLAGMLIAWLFLSGHAGFLSNQRDAKAVLLEKSVAVLPFENISPNKEDVYFADGVQDEILNSLAKIAQLKVISRTSVMKYRAGTERDLRQIANALGVANVLEGAVRRDGNRVRVSTELVDARNDNTIWADSYDRNLTDIFTIQSEIAQKVASTLAARLSPEERRDIEEKPTNNLEAYDLYLQAKRLLEANYWVERSKEKQIYSNIISLLEDAVQKDNRFVLAYCLITKAHDVLYDDGTDRTPERRALGDTAVNEALRLRPDLPEAHLAMANHLYYCYRDLERAGIQIQIAARALSNSSDVLELAALIDRAQGRWENSIAALERAMILDPRSPEILGILSDTYGACRRFRDAKRVLDRLIQLEPNNVEFLLSKVWFTFAEKADPRAALATFDALPSSVKHDPGVATNRVWYAVHARDFSAGEEIIRNDLNEEISFCRALVPREIFTLWLEFIQGNHPTVEQYGAAREQVVRKVEAHRTDPFLMTALAWADVALGRNEEAIEEAGRAIELRPISEDAFDGADVAMYVAQVYALANQSDAAFAQLNTLVKIPGASLNYGELKTNPGWDPLRKDPRFDKLLAALAPRD